jgi:hypothetical protein
MKNRRLGFSTSVRASEVAWPQTAPCGQMSGARLSEVIAHEIRTHVPVEVNAVARPEVRITVCDRQGFLERVYPEGRTPKSLQTERRGLVCLCIAAGPRE